MNKPDFQDLPELPSMQRYTPNTERTLEQQEPLSPYLTVSDQGEAQLCANPTSAGGQRAASAIFDGHYTRKMGDREESFTGVEISGDPSLVLHGHTSPIAGVAFGMVGQSVVTTCEGGKIMVHGLPTGVLQASHTLKAPTYGVAPALSSTRGVLAVLLRDHGSQRRRKKVRIWYRPTGDFADLMVKKGSPCCLALSPDGGSLVLGHENGLLELWSVAGVLGMPTFKKQVKLARYEGAISAVAFSPGGKALGVLTSERQLISWLRA